MSFPPGPIPIIPPPPSRGVLNWDVPLDAVLVSLTTTQQAAWQNAVDTATAVLLYGITHVDRSASEIANPIDGQLCYNKFTRVYLRFDGSTAVWVPFQTGGSGGGAQLLNGTVDPSSAVGNDGDF